MGREGSVVWVGAAAGPPGTYTGIHITEHSGPLAPDRWTVGHLRKTGCRGPSQAAIEKQLNHDISPPTSHMKQLLGERGREHTSEVGVKIQAWQMRCFP